MARVVEYQATLAGVRSEVVSTINPELVRRPDELVIRIVANARGATAVDCNCYLTVDQRIKLWVGLLYVVVGQSGRKVDPPAVRPLVEPLAREMIEAIASQSPRAVAVTDLPVRFVKTPPRDPRVVIRDDLDG